MLSPNELYPLVLGCLQALGAAPQATATAALAHPVTALLTAQSLRPSALMRALLSPDGVPARQRYKRLRCGRWEIYTVGLVWHGRALPVAWAVLPYPLPKGRFGPTVEALVRAVAAAWPGGHAAPHLVADRAFPSLRLFRALRRLGWGFTVRVRATDGVRVGGARRVVRDLLAAACPGGWTARPATFGSGPTAVPGTLVIGRGLEVIPAHQAGPASLRERGRRRAGRERHLATKKAGRSGDGLRAADRWVALFTTHPGWRAATTSYGRRWAIEGSYRDAQGGWDGRHGWDLEPTAARLRAAGEVEALVGLWALGALLQSYLGDRAGAADAPTAVRAVVAQWTTTGRLSVWARGKLALVEPSGRLRAWLAETLADGARCIAAGPICPTAVPAAVDPITWPEAA